MSRMKLVKLFAVAMLPFASVGMAGAATAEPVEVSTASQDIMTTGDTTILHMYISKHDTGVKYRFDMDKAREDGVSEDVLRIGEYFNEYSIAKDDPYSKLSLPVWGNWCGPGHSGPGVPVDALDANCMNHDKCYAAKGYFNCSCDKDLIAGINRDFWRMGWREKAVALAIKAYFEAQSAHCN